MLKMQLGLETARVLDFDSIRRLIEFGFWILALITLVTLELTSDQRKRITRASGPWPTPILLFHSRVLAVLQRVLSAHPKLLEHPTTNWGRSTMSIQTPRLGRVEDVPKLVSSDGEPCAHS